MWVRGPCHFRFRGTLIVATAAAQQHSKVLTKEERSSWVNMERAALPCRAKPSPERAVLVTRHHTSVALDLLGSRPALVQILIY